MTITAKNIGRINVWPTYRVAREADTEQSKFTGQLTVWQTNEEALANTTHEEEGGGGGAPAWVPANAVIHIDLVGGDPQGRAWVAGAGEVAVDTLLGSDDTGAAWGDTEYDPAGLAADGYDTNLTVNGFDVALIGAARTMVLDAATVVVRSKTISDAISTALALISADGGEALEVDVRRTPHDDLSVSSWSGPLSYYIEGSVNSGAGSINVVALTVTASRFDSAINGFAAVAGALESTDRPPGSPLTLAVYDTNNCEYLQSITLYDPLPSTAGLSDLSEVA